MTLVAWTYIFEPIEADPIRAQATVQVCLHSLLLIGLVSAGYLDHTCTLDINTKGSIASEDYLFNSPNL